MIVARKNYQKSLIRSKTKMICKTLKMKFARDFIETLIVINMKNTKRYL